MTDDKKSIPDAGRVDESLKPGKVESVKAGPPLCAGSAHPRPRWKLPGERMYPGWQRPLRRGGQSGV